MKTKIDNCACGREHTCPIKHISVREGAIEDLSSFSSAYNKILLVADENTYRAAGDRVEKQIREKIQSRIVFDGNRVLIPDERAIDRIKESVKDGCDLIIGIGSGVINDLAKHVSFISGLPYFIVATAPSMDGYASRGAALILGGMKVTLNANVPEAIIADIDVIKDAPMDMIISGYGDIVGKYSCLADWKLASLLFNEYLCEYILSCAYSEIEKTVAVAKRLTVRDPAAIRILTQALISVGVLMAYVGTSRPASGSEHHFSHYFEIVGIIKNEPYFSHGTDVFYSTVETSLIRERLLSLTEGDISDYVFNKQLYEEAIKRVYGMLAPEVISLQYKLGWYNQGSERIKRYKEKLPEIKRILASVPTADQFKKMLSDVGLDYDTFKNMYGESKIADAYFYAKDLKDRFTVLWMYYDLFVNR